MKRIEPDDPRLTAYVLGELQGDERKEVEELLAASPDARAVVDGLTQTSGVLEEALTKEAAATGGIGGDRKEALPKPAPAHRTFHRSPWWLAAAALMGVLIAVVWSVNPSFLGDRGGGGASPAPEMAALEDEAGIARDRAGNARSDEPSKPNESLSTVAFDGRPDGEAAPPPAVRTPNTASKFAAHLEAKKKQPRPEVENALRVLRAETATAATPGERERLLRALTEATKADGINLNPSGFGAGVGGMDGESGEAYSTIVENSFMLPTSAPLSTFSLDVDTAAYANVRRFLRQNQIPPRDAVRLEELVNYFRYDDPAPGTDSEHPIRVSTEVARCWWNLKHKLVRVGVRAKDIPFEKRPFQNLVFLIDVSGSMQPENKLPLLKKGFRMLVDTLGENDRVSIVVYASATGLVLEPTTGDHKQKILDALDRLRAGGSTNGSGGIQLAYQTAVENFVQGGNNRVILATDGDFNVGTTDRSQLTDLITDKAKSGVFLSVLGFGQGNLKDATMEQLADKGNGNYSYIDCVDEAEKVLVREIGGTLITVAKDVKLQVEFNPAKVAAYRLLGYENRVLLAKDFNDDTKDAGEIGAGHSICALYEVVPAGDDAVVPGIDPLKYQESKKLSAAALGKELLTVKMRYKKPAGSQSTKLEFPLEDADRPFDEASRDLRWSSAVAAFGLLLRASEHRGQADWPAIMEVCAGAIGDDPHGDRKGFVELVVKASELSQR